MRPSKDQWAMNLALVTARRATCLRRQVGCVLLNARGHVLATGYNGVAAGQPHCNEARFKPEGNTRISSPIPVIGHRGIVDMTVEYFPHACPGAKAPSGTNLDACQAIHAEQNALLQCRDVYSIHTAYVTASPCITCCKLLMNTSCQRIVFLEDYPHGEAQGFWEKAGREWIKISTET